jgi:hypothetical protein
MASAEIVLRPDLPLGSGRLPARLVWLCSSEVLVTRFDPQMSEKIKNRRRVLHAPRLLIGLQNAAMVNFELAPAGRQETATSDQRGADAPRSTG